MREDVELRECERGDPVQSHCVAERDEVEPAATPFAPGDRPELAAELTHALLIGAFDLRWERTFSDPGHIGLGDADHPVDSVGPDPDPRRCVARDRVRRRHERICAVVEIEERPLRTLH